MALSKDSKAYTLMIATVICLVGSVLVSTAAVVLKPQQAANQQRDRQVNILRVAGLYEPGVDVAAVFEERVESKVIDFTTGEVADEMDPATFDANVVARDPANRITLKGAEDIAGVGSHAKYGLVYLVRDDDDKLSRIVLPIRGYGLWSTMYAFWPLKPMPTRLPISRFTSMPRPPGSVARSRTLTGRRNGKARKFMVTTAILPSVWCAAVLRPTTSTASTRCPAPP